MYLEPEFIDESLYEKESPFSFRKHTTIGCGGYAKIGFFPATELLLVQLVSLHYGKNLPYLVVGNMSNVLPTDDFLNKTIICTKKYKEIVFEGREVYVSSGVSAGALLFACQNAGKSGLEFLEGIPCTIGGALYMNAGVSGMYISERVCWVKVWHKGKIILLNADECAYAYKSSIFMQEDYVILGAKLRLDSASTEEISEKISLYKNRRKNLPKGRSMGCVFKNPQGGVAGKLIEGAGLKGLRLGGARISEEHANFIINDGYATSAQVRELIGLMQSAVQKQYGIQLEEEIRYLN